MDDWFSEEPEFFSSLLSRCLIAFADSQCVCVWMMKDGGQIEGSGQRTTSDSTCYELLHAETLTDTHICKYTLLFTDMSKSGHCIRLYDSFEFRIYFFIRFYFLCVFSVFNVSMLFFVYLILGLPKLMLLY